MGEEAELMNLKADTQQGAPSSRIINLEIAI